jgi:N-acetylglucosamine kinase-like BadF-type ATPase
MLKKQQEMIVIADSGSSKTHWKVIKPNGEIVGFETIGLNPYHCSNEVYSQVLIQNFPPSVNSADISQVYFYGAGCASEGKSEAVRLALSFFFKQASIEVHSDLLGASRALFGDGSGLTLILGTGSSIGYFDGKIVTRITPSLGYILGDEGSGTDLGKRLIVAWQYGDLPKELSSALQEFCPLSLAQLLEKVYSTPLAAKFLSSFVPFMVSHVYHPYIQNLITQSFDSMVEKHLVKHPKFKTTQIGTVGSVGSIFSELLSSAVLKHEGKLFLTLRYPIDNLVEYHRKAI